MEQNREEKPWLTVTSLWPDCWGPTISHLIFSAFLLPGSSQAHSLDYEAGEGGQFTCYESNEWDEDVWKSGWLGSVHGPFPLPGSRGSWHSGSAALRKGHGTGISDPVPDLPGCLEMLQKAASLGAVN